MRGPFAKTLIKRTVSGPLASPTKGSSAARRRMSSAGQTITSVSNERQRRNSMRNFASLNGWQTTKVPVAPTLMTPCFASCLATSLGRNVLCPPTFTPLKKTACIYLAVSDSAQRGVEARGLSGRQLQLDDALAQPNAAWFTSGAVDPGAGQLAVLPGEVHHETAAR